MSRENSPDCPGSTSVEMDSVSNEAYFRWLDEMADRIDRLVLGAQIAEQENARTTPPLNTAIDYDRHEIANALGIS